jgi:uncharacterized protein YqhQ
MSELNYGGQAVMEGVMMRGHTAMAVAVRAPSGQIVVHSEPLNKAIYQSWIAKVPFLRGITLLWDTMVLGMRTLMFSADIAVQDQGVSLSPSGEGGESILTSPLAWGSIALSLSIAVGLFFLLPAMLTKFVDRYLFSSLVSNLVEGMIRLLFVVGYVWAVGFLPDIRRVFAYHGAEHKTVHAYEHERPLTVDAIRRYSTAHERCGTSFILIVVIISVLVFSLLGRPPLLLRLASRVLMLPVIVGIAYEWLKLGARHSEKWWMKALLAPGLAMQRLTTREPDDQMLEVAIAALERVLQEDSRPVTADVDTATPTTS